MVVPMMSVAMVVMAMIIVRMTGVVVVRVIVMPMIVVRMAGVVVVFVAMIVMIMNVARMVMPRRTRLFVGCSSFSHDRFVLSRLRLGRPRRTNKKHCISTLEFTQPRFSIA